MTSSLGPLADRLRADLDHLGVDDPSLLGDFAGGRDEATIIADCVMDLPGPMRAEFLAAWSAPWAMVMVLHDRHPSIRQVVRWARSQPETILVLATPSGPIAPAVQLIVAPAVDDDGSPEFDVDPPPPGSRDGDS